MSGSEIIENDDKKKKKRGGSVEPPQDGRLSAWIERYFRGGETPQSIDGYPLFKGRDKEERLYHYDVKADESVDAERSVELANEIFSDCQLHCDSLPRTGLSREGSKTYQIAIIDSRRGGLASPVGTFLLKLMPRSFAPAPEEGEDTEGLSAEDGEGLTGRKMMMSVFTEIMGKDERSQQGVNLVVGEVMLLQKEHIKESFEMIREMHRDNRALMTEWREAIRQAGMQRVEEKAVAIDAANAEVERDIKRAQMTKENMWTDVIRAGMLEAVKVLGALFPGFGQLFVALVSGKPVPPPPQLPGTSGESAAQPQLPAAQASSQQPGTPPQLPAPEEKKLVDRFIETAEKHKIDETHTAAEHLFGKDGKAGVFTLEQVAILTGVHVGALPIDTLDALLPDSGKPEAIQGLQMAKAIAYSTPEMISDITKFVELRKNAREKR